MVGDFFYYDRKEDNDLPRGAIEKAIEDEDIRPEEIAQEFIDCCGFKNVVATTIELEDDIND